MYAQEAYPDVCTEYVQNTYLYIYIYIYIERERERDTRSLHGLLTPTGHSQTQIWR